MERVFAADAPIVGMVHLPPLPGSPGFDGDRAAVHDAARRDARRLAEGGVDAVLVENYGDAPFYPEDVPDSTVAELTAVVGTVTGAVDVPVGVNVLRNDAAAALAVAGATGASFVRVNVHTGVRATDQGVVSGRAHETMRLRETHDVDAAVLADVAVKHSAPLADRSLAAAARDCVERGLADAVVVSGPETGETADADAIDTVAGSVDVPVFVGSGVTADNAADLLAVADGAIVGTAFKRDGITTEPVETARVRRLVESVSARPNYVPTGRTERMDDPLPDVTAAFARAVGTAGDEVVAEMDERARREGFPTVGPAVGGWLRLLARAVGTERAFEFGSGFGYSAYWLAPAIPADGRLVLTEIDADELDAAREYLARGGYDDRAVFEHGDAIDIVDRYDGPFEFVLIDNEKDRYVEAFESVREKVPVGGVVCADNAMTAGHVDFAALSGALVDGRPIDDTTDATRGVADYLDHVRGDGDFETTLLPLGEGVAVSLRTA